MSSEMQAGRALDAQIAEKVMGWLRLTRAIANGYWFGPSETLGEKDLWGETRLYDPRLDEDKPLEGWCLAESSQFGPVVPHYSTDIATAWQVVEKLAKTGINIVIEYDDSYEKPWHAKVGYDGEWELEETAPLAICLAALKTAGKGGAR